MSKTTDLQQAYTRVLPARVNKQEVMARGCGECLRPPLYGPVSKSPDTTRIHGCSTS